MVLILLVWPTFRAQIAKIMNSQRLPGIRSDNSFEPDICKEEYIKLLKLYGESVDPMDFDGGLCSMALGYLVYRIYLQDLRFH